MNCPNESKYHEGKGVELVQTVHTPNLYECPKCGDEFNIV